MSASTGIGARWTTVAALLAVLAACETTPSDELDLDAVLTERGACGDAVFYAISEGDAAVLALWATGLHAAAVEADGTVETAWSFPEDGAAIEAYFGTRVGTAICDGPPSATLVDHAYVATVGEVVATVAPDGAASVTLTDVVLTHVEGRGDPLTVPSMTIAGTLGAE